VRRKISVVHPKVIIMELSSLPDTPPLFFGHFFKGTKNVG